MDVQVFLKMFEEKYGKVEILDKALLIQAHSMFNEILASSNKSERSKVVHEVMEFVESWTNPAEANPIIDVKVLNKGLARMLCDKHIHLSDCALHNEPAELNGKCNCGAKLDSMKPDKEE